MEKALCWARFACVMLSTLRRNACPCSHPLCTSSALFSQYFFFLMQKVSYCFIFFPDACRSDLAAVRLGNHLSAVL